MRSAVALLACMGLVSAPAGISRALAQPSFDGDNGLAFWQVVDALWETDTAIVLVQSEMGLSEADASDLVYRIQSAGRFIRNEQAGIDQQIACEAGVPAATGDGVYQLLEETFAARAQISEKHLRLLKKDIGAEQSSRLQKWLNRQKTQNTMQAPNYRAILGSRGISPDVVIAKICDTSKTQADGSEAHQ